MRRFIVAVLSASLVAACGGGDGMEDAGDAVGGEGGDGEFTPAPPPGPRPDDLVLYVRGRGPASPDVKALRLAPRKVAFHFGDPAEPLFDGVPGEPVTCEASVATFVRDAPSEAHLALGSTDTRLRLAGIDLDRGALLVEAWILIERGSAHVERPGGQLRPVHLPACRDARGTMWSVVRAVPSRPLLVTDGVEVTATVDVRATSFIVETSSCVGPEAPAECAADDDQGDDGDPDTRLVYVLHSLPMHAGP